MECLANREWLDIVETIILVLDFKGNVTFINKKGCKILGYKESDIVGKNWFDNFVFLEDKKNIRAVFNKIIKGEKEPVEYYENPIKTRLGKRLISWHNSVLKDDKGKIIGTLGSGEDITEKREVLEKIKNSKEMLQKIIDLLPVRIFWKDKKLRYLGCNVIFAKDAGKSSPKELIGKDDYEMGWKDQAELYRKADFEVISSGKSKINFKEPQTTPDGKNIWLLTTKVPLKDLNGKISGILGTYLDITKVVEADKKIEESEKMYKTLFESSCDAILTLSPPLWNFTSGNRLAFEMFGIKKEKQFFGFSPWSLSPEKQPDGQLSIEKSKIEIEKAMREGSNSFEWIHKKLNGNAFPAIVSLTKIKIKGEYILQATIRNISEQKKESEELEKFNQFAVDRELKMVELKKEINELLKQTGKAPKYKKMEDDK
jgi:PAS domain S-box-containing protein